MKKNLKGLISLVVSGILVSSVFLTGFTFKAKSVEDKGTVTVGSKNFTESLVLGELYADALEGAGYKVERKLNLGDAIVHTSLVSGDIDFYPEYTGTGLLSILKEAPLFDAEKVYKEVSAQYKKKFNLVWLNHSAANDAQGLVISKRASLLYKIKTISDLQKNASKIRFASQGEFNVRADGLPALKKTYGDFKFKSIKIYNNSLKYDVLHNNKADLAVAYTTEGQLSKDEFVVLKDDKHVWPPYNIAPVIRQEVLDKYPEIKDVLNKVTAKLDDKTVIKLNAQVDIDKKEYTDVAKDFYNKELSK